MSGCSQVLLEARQQYLNYEQLLWHDTLAIIQNYTALNSTVSTTSSQAEAAPQKSSGRTAMNSLTTSSLTALRAAWCACTMGTSTSISRFLTSPVSISPFL